MAPAGSGKGRAKKAAAKKKRKVAVSRKTQPPPRGASDNTPSRIANMPVGDTSNLDVANEIARRKRKQLTAAAPVQQPPQQLSAVLAGESSLTANLEITEAADTAAFTATVAWPEYEEMLRRVSELEATVAKLPLPPSTAGIGHNYPPPLDTAELEELKQEISRLKAQPPPPPAEASKTASKFIHHSMQVLLWFWKKLDTFIDEFTKTAGKTAGLAIGALPIWLTFGQQLSDTAAAIMKWLTALLGQ
jgi:hypothetical protein